MLAALAVLVGACATEPVQPSVTTVVTTATPSTPAPSAPLSPLSLPTTVPASTTTLAPLQGLAVELVVEGLDQPTFVTSPPGDGRLFVVERVGTVVIVDPERGLLPDPFIDLRDRVSSGGIEQGLLGLAFHPDYADNGRFFVYYTDLGANSRLVEHRVGSHPDQADAGGERVVLAFDQFVDRHYGGMLLFGPEGFLYVSLGEGGKASAHAQNPDSMLAAILRLDVDHGDPYATPADNPFAAGGGAPEVWAKGLRNPWRFSIDPVEGLVYIADVGHTEWEEINVVPLEGGGYNFGWLPMEGSRCFQGRTCDPTGKVLPVVEYSHAEGCSVTGGFVYRGQAIPELVGHYFYADWCGGWVRSFRYLDGEATEARDWSADVGEIGQVNSFGLDAAGELYLATHEGSVYRIVPER